MQKYVLALDDDDDALLDYLRCRLRCTRTDALRWALRWYAASGPHRDPDDRLPAELVEILTAREVGPRQLKGVS